MSEKRKKPIIIAPPNMAYGEFNSTVPFPAFVNLFDDDRSNEMTYAELYDDEEEENPLTR